MQLLVIGICLFNILTNIVLKFKGKLIHFEKYIFLFSSFISLTVGFLYISLFKCKYEFDINILNSMTIRLGNTNLSDVFAVLSTFIMFLCSLDLVNKKSNVSKSYINLMLVMEIFLMLTFFSLDILSFFIFFEGSIIPIFFIILNYGGADKIRAAKQFLTYTIAGSSLFLVTIIYLFSTTNSLIPSEIGNSLHFINNIPENVKIFLSIISVVAFFVKIPVFPFHTWLPLAHVEATTSGSVILAGILIKLGGFGLIQYVMPIFFEQIYDLRYIYISFGLVSLIYGSVISFAQKDLKKMIAYSSIAHMSYVVFGIFSFDKNGINSAIFQMVAHGVISAGLFFLIDVIYSRYKTRNINDFGNLYTAIPYYNKFFLLICFASAGLPGTVGFIGEFLNITSVANLNSVLITILASSGALLGASYMLLLCYKILFSNHENEKITPSKLTYPEMLFLSFISISILLFGVFPDFILRYL